jgi:tetratricopeptide (TPR) repeat protein
VAINYQQMGWTERAEEVFKNAESTYEALVHDHPENTQYRLMLSAVYSDLGRLYNENMRQPERAEVFFQQALQIWVKLAQEHPDVLSYDFLVGLIHGKLASAAHNARRPDVALTRSDSAIELLERAANRGHPQAPLQLAGARVIRAAVLAQRGEYLKAIDEAETILRNGERHKANLYNVCCIFCLAADAAAGDSKLSPPDRDRLKAQYADRAMDVLRQAVAAGLRNVTGMKGDKDLTCLHSRADFQKLIQELELKTKQEDSEKK